MILYNINYDLSCLGVSPLLNKIRCVAAKLVKVFFDMYIRVEFVVYFNGTFNG